MPVGMSTSIAAFDREGTANPAWTPCGELSHRGRVVFPGRTWGVVVFVVWVSACAEPRSTEPLRPSPTQGPTPDDGTGDAADSDAPGSPTGDETTTTGNLKLDVGADTADVDGSASDGCRAVDLLFVVDRSESMAEEQTNLIASVPKWFDAIETRLPDVANYHVMAVDMDDRWGTPYCEGCSSGCTYDNGLDVWEVPNYPCTHTPSLCDAELGAGRVINGGYRASNADCAFPEGRRWLRYDDEGLETRFSCAVQVGVSGPGNEQPTMALAAAVGADTTAGDCNAGFIRDDALLVVVLVTDEDEGDFVGDEHFDEVVAPRVFGQLIDLKGGDPNGVVMISLIDDFEAGPDAECEAPAFPLNFGPAPHLRRFTELFPRHVFGSVCAPDYSIPLVEAIETIDEACREFVPAG